MGQRWLEERLWCLQLCETWPQCLGEGGDEEGVHPAGNEASLFWDQGPGQRHEMD